jgi:hypothetical protein
MPLDGHFDPLGETEPENTTYTLLAFCPARPPPKWLPGFVTRKPVTYPKTGARFTIKPDNTNPCLDCFEEKHLDEMSTKVIKIKSSLFPLELRCVHVRYATTCKKGCYVLERSSPIARWHCTDNKCKGHVYCGSRKTDKEGRACFGKKGKRMVCIEK